MNTFLFQIGGVVAAIVAALTAYFSIRGDGKKLQQRDDLDATLKDAKTAADVENKVSSMSDAAAAKLLRDRWGPK